MLVAVVDQLEKEHRTVAAQGQVADLIDDQGRSIARGARVVMGPMARVASRTASSAGKEL
jgi:hypothetical protein